MKLDLSNKNMLVLELSGNELTNPYLITYFKDLKEDILKYNNGLYESPFGMSNYIETGILNISSKDTKFSSNRILFTSVSRATLPNKLVIKRSDKNFQELLHDPVLKGDYMVGNGYTITAITIRDKKTNEILNKYTIAQILKYIYNNLDEKDKNHMKMVISIDDIDYTYNPPPIEVNLSNTNLLELRLHNDENYEMPLIKKFKKLKDTDGISILKQFINNNDYEYVPKRFGFSKINGDYRIYFADKQGKINNYSITKRNNSNEIINKERLQSLFNYIYNKLNEEGKNHMKKMIDTNDVDYLIAPPPPTMGEKLSASFNKFTSIFKSKSKGGRRRRSINSKKRKSSHTKRKSNRRK